MKKYVVLALLVAMAWVGCQRKTTQEAVKKAESALFNEDQTVNAEAVPEAVATFNNYVEEHPEAADAPEVLFKAIEVSINTRQEAQQSIDMVNRLLTNYPEFDKNPVALFMMATFVYDEQLHDLDQARETYQRIIDNYPDSPFANDAAISITQLGMTPEELIRMFEERNN